MGWLSKMWRGTKGRTEVHQDVRFGDSIEWSNTSATSLVHGRFCRFFFPLKVLMETQRKKVYSICRGNIIALQLPPPSMMPIHINRTAGIGTGP
jgi:hypothetical protein